MSESGFSGLGDSWDWAWGGWRMGPGMWPAALGGFSSFCFVVGWWVSFVVGVGRAVREPPLRLALAGLGPAVASAVGLSFSPPFGGGSSMPCKAVTRYWLWGCRRRSPADTWGSRTPPPQDVPGWLTARLIRLHSRLGLRPAKALGLRWLRSFWVSPGVRTWNGGDLFGTGSPDGTPKHTSDLLLPPLVLSQHQLRQDGHIRLEIGLGSFGVRPFWPVVRIARAFWVCQGGSFHHRGHREHREGSMGGRRSGRGVEGVGKRGVLNTCRCCRLGKSKRPVRYV